MEAIALQPLANQSFAVSLSDNQWIITIKTTAGVTSISIKLNNIDVIFNTRAVANQLIIPYEYEEAGNFMFLTQNQQLPDYTQFGAGQQLVYITADELAIFREPKNVPITAADFSPLAALPLRFAPQGYVLA